MRLISLATVRLALAVTAVTVASGCYQSRDVELILPTAPLSVPAVGLGRAITIARPLDARPNAYSIGCLFDPPREDAVAVAHPKNDPAVWIGDAFASGLEKAGYRVYRSESAEQAVTPLVLRITVNEAYTTFRTVPSPTGWPCFSGEARIAVQVEALRSGNRILRRSYSGISSKDYAISEAGNPIFFYGPSADQYRQSLQEAMQRMLEKAIPNLASGLAQKGF